MRRRHLFYWIVFVGCLGLVVGVWVHRNADDRVPEDGKSGTERISSQKGTHTSVETSVSGVAKTFHEHAYVHEHGLDDHGNPVVVPPEIPAEKLERINALYDRLPRTKARARAIEVLTEGMDALSAAKYLKTLDGFHGDFRGDAYKYADRALAEDSDSFDALFLKTELSLEHAEKVAGFRQLYEMNPHSFDVVHSLGAMLAIRNPEEAVEYLQQAVAMRPKEPGPYIDLGRSYHKLGRLEEALATYQKAHQLHPDSFSQMGIDHVENDIEWARAQGNKEAVPEETAPEETFSEAPLQEDMPQPALTDTLGETDPGEGSPEDEKRTLSPEARQAMEAELEKLIAEYERMIRGESSPTDVGNQQILDLKRSIESSPNRSDSYLELGRAYEKAGEGKKASEVYRQARKRFPKDKRFQRTEKDGAPPRGKSGPSRKRRGGARSDADKDPPPESKQ